MKRNREGGPSLRKEKKEDSLRKEGERIAFERKGNKVDIDGRRESIGRCSDERTKVDRSVLRRL